MSTPSREALIDVARSWVGTPFRAFGRTRTGVDCAGLLICVAREVGFDDGFEVDETYTMSANNELLLRQLDRAELIVIGRRDALAGDIIIMAQARTERGSGHLGFLADHPKGGRSIIHAQAHGKRGRPASVVEQPLGHLIDMARHFRRLPIFEAA